MVKRLAIVAGVVLALVGAFLVFQNFAFDYSCTPSGKRDMQIAQGDVEALVPGLHDPELNDADCDPWPFGGFASVTYRASTPRDEFRTRMESAEGCSLHDDTYAIYRCARSGVLYEVQADPASWPSGSVSVRVQRP